MTNLALYRVLPPNPADEVHRTFLTATDPHELELAAHNLLLSFGAVLAAMDDERVQVIESCPLLGLAELVKDSRGMDINTSSRRWTPMPSAEGSGTQP